MTVYGSSLIFDVDSSYLRLGLRVYFTGLFTLLALAGDQCCKLRVMRHLMRRHSVCIPQMTGWLSGWSAARIWMKLRHSPAGWLGLVMIIAQLLAFSSDLLVSGLVRTITVPARCPFGTGIVIPQQAVTWRSNPSLNQNATRIVTQARITSRTNGGLTGIYSKVNSDASFRADAQDVIGSWVCSDIHNDTSYPPSLTLTPQDVLDNLVNSGLLYNGSSAASGNIPSLGWNTFVGWGASVLNNVAMPWDARVAVDMTGFAGNESVYNPRLIRTFDCTLNGSSIDWILTMMDGDTTMEQWVLALQDSIYAGGATAVTESIAGMLEIMTQVGWGGSVSTNDTTTVNPTQGCLSPRAEIPLPVFLLLLVTTIGVAFMLTYWATLLLLVRSAASSLSKRWTVYVERNTPNGLASWMTQAVREHGISQDIQEKNLSKWAFLLGDNGKFTIQ
jgi:hypothetical protein